MPLCLLQVCLCWYLLFIYLNESWPQHPCGTSCCDKTGQIVESPIVINSSDTLSTIKEMPKCRYNGCKCSGDADCDSKNCPSGYCVPCPGKVHKILPFLITQKETVSLVVLLVRVAQALLATKGSVCNKS